LNQFVFFASFLQFLGFTKMKEIILEYYQHMKLIDSTFSWSNKFWWESADNAKIILSGISLKPSGFCIIGYNDLVDADVNCEICDLNCTNPFSLLSLLRSSIKHIQYPFGFQILVNNQRAINTFELILKKFNFTYKKIFSIDGESKVFKYRIYSNYIT